MPTASPLDPPSPPPSPPPIAVVSTPKVYPSAVDAWLGILLALGPMCPIVLSAILIFQGRHDQALTLLLVGAATTALTAVLVIPCRYTIHADHLAIRCGLIFYRVMWTEIQSIEPSNSWLSGPALSLRRVAIRTAKRTIRLSPNDRSQFIADLRVVMDRDADR